MSYIFEIFIVCDIRLFLSIPTSVFNSVCCNFLIINYSWVLSMHHHDSDVDSTLYYQTTACKRDKWFQLVILVLEWTYRANTWYSHSFGITNDIAIFDVDANHIYVIFWRINFLLFWHECIFMVLMMLLVW